MSAKRVKFSGAISVEDLESCCAGLASACGKAFESCFVGSTAFEQTRSLASPVTWIDLLGPAGLAAAKIVFLKISGGSGQVRFTTAAGVDQVVSLSDQFFMTTPGVGLEITALAVRGSATSLQIVVAG